MNGTEYFEVHSYLPITTMDIIDPIVIVHKLMLDDLFVIFMAISNLIKTSKVFFEINLNFCTCAFHSTAPHFT